MGTRTEPRRIDAPDRLTPQQRKLHECFRKQADPCGSLRRISPSQECDAQRLLEGKAALLPVARQRREDSKQRAGHTTTVVKRQFEAAIEHASFFRERRGHELTGVVILMASLPGQAEHLVDVDAPHSFAKTFECDIEMFDERPVGNRDLRSDESDPIAADAQGLENGETFAVAQTGWDARSSVGEKRAEHVRTTSQLELDARRRCDLIILVSEHEEDHGS